MTEEKFWDEPSLTGLLNTIQADKAEVLAGLREQDQGRSYSAHEVITILELVFTLVETSIKTEMDEALNHMNATGSTRS